VLAEVNFKTKEEKMSEAVNQSLTKK